MNSYELTEIYFTKTARCCANKYRPKSPFIVDKRGQEPMKL